MIRVTPRAALAENTRVAKLVITGTNPGNYPYSATLLLKQGLLPANRVLISDDNSIVDFSVLSRWEDSSASVVVVSGTVSFVNNFETKTLNLNHGVPVNQSGVQRAGTRSPMVRYQDSGLREVEINLGTEVLHLTDFTKPSKIWWSNSQTICARYVLKSLNHIGVVAVIDVQHYRNRAFVEITVENSLLNTVNPSAPSPARYVCEVYVNNNHVSTVETDNSPDDTGSHTAFRAWYCNTWVGGSTGLTARQDHLELQEHPLLFKCDQESNFQNDTYQYDKYKPWSSGRHRRVGMGGAGDHPSIGPITQWDARFLQTGNINAAKAVVENTLCIVGYNVNYRNNSTLGVPSFSEVNGRSMQINWPVNYGVRDTMSWKVSHHPAVGLMAFVVRPSPVFIELAQKVALWNGTWSTWGGTPTGVFGRAYQLRGKAWCIRSLAHAIFITPDNDTWKNSARTSLSLNVDHLLEYVNDPKARLNCFWEAMPRVVHNTFNWVPGYSLPLWQHHYLTVELHKVESAKILRADDQPKLKIVSDWAALQPVRWVNEQREGAWRYIHYGNIIGRDPVTIDSLPDYKQQQQWWMLDTVNSEQGPWMSSETVSNRTYSSFRANDSAGGYYPSYFWSALVAAVERNVEGANTAWQIVNNNVANLDRWRKGFAHDPRWGSTPRVLNNQRGSNDKQAKFLS